MDINEEIILSWISECKKMFHINNIDYGQFHNDIDILTIDLKNKIVWDCEVKIRTGTTKIADTDNKTNGFKKFVSTFNSALRKDKISQYIPSDFVIQRKFITTKSLLGTSCENQSKWIKKFNDETIDILFVEDIINELNSYANNLNYSDNSIIQTLRLLNLGTKSNRN